MDLLLGAQRSAAASLNLDPSKVTIACLDSIGSKILLSTGPMHSVLNSTNTDVVAAGSASQSAGFILAFEVVFNGSQNISSTDRSLQTLDFNFTVGGVTFHGSLAAGATVKASSILSIAVKVNESSGGMAKVTSENVASSISQSLNASGITVQAYSEQSSSSPSPFAAPLRAPMSPSFYPPPPSPINPLLLSSLSSSLTTCIKGQSCSGVALIALICIVVGGVLVLACTVIALWHYFRWLRRTSREDRNRDHLRKEELTSRRNVAGNGREGGQGESRVEIDSRGDERRRETGRQSESERISTAQYVNQAGEVKFVQNNITIHAASSDGGADSPLDQRRRTLVREGGGEIKLARDFVIKIAEDGDLGVEWKKDLAERNGSGTKGEKEWWKIIKNINSPRTQETNLKSPERAQRTFSEISLTPSDMEAAAAAAAAAAVGGRGGLTDECEEEQSEQQGQVREEGREAGPARRGRDHTSVINYVKFYYYYTLYKAMKMMQ